MNNNQFKNKKMRQLTRKARRALPARSAYKKRVRKTAHRKRMSVQQKRAAQGKR